MRLPQAPLDTVAALPAVATVRDAAARTGVSVSLVGSGLRDVLLGLQSRTFDFLVDGSVERLARQVATIVPGGMVAVDGRSGALRYRTHVLGDVQFLPARGLSAGQYLARVPEFTINAVAFDLQRGSLVAGQGALADLAAQCVRRVRRIPAGVEGAQALRAVRLALLTTAFTIEAETRAAIEAGGSSLDSGEMPGIGYELHKILGSPEYQRGTRLLFEMGLLETVLMNACGLLAVLGIANGSGSRIDLGSLMQRFTCHDEMCARYAPVVARHAPLMRQVILLTAALRAHGLDAGGDEGTRCLKGRGAMVERAFECLSAQYSSRGIYPFRVRMLLVGSWLGMATLARGITFMGMVTLLRETYGVRKGLLCALLVAAEWIGRQQRPDVERTQVQDALQRLWPRESGGEAA